MFTKVTFFGICLILCQIYCIQSAAVEPEYAVDFKSESGDHFRFPFYKNIKTLDPRLREATKDQTVQILGYVKEVIGHSLLGQKVSRFGWLGVTANFISIAKKGRTARKDIPSSVGTKGTFNGDMQQMFKHMMQLAKAQEKQAEPADPVALKKQLDKTLDGLIEAVKRSYVSQYFDWSKGEINGTPFIEFSAHIMAKMSENGYGGILNCIDSLLTSLTYLSNLG